MRYDWYDCPVPSLALARRRLRERRAEVPDPFQVVAGADQPPLHHQAESATAPARRITCDGVDRVQLDGGPLGPGLDEGKVS